MKDLRDLVPSIYTELEKLSDGTPLPLTDADIDKTVEGLREALKSWARPSVRNREFTLRMSNIGKPTRQLWFEKRDKNANNSINGSTQVKFLYGHMLEEIALMLVRMVGYSVTDEQKEVDVNGVLGHMDCKINGEVVDVKTASRFAFNKFRHGTLAEDDPFGYLGQLAGYEEAEGTEHGGFFVINKESGELCMYQPDDFDKPIITDKISKTIKALDLDSKPELCYNPIPDGKKGNIKLPKGCNWCKYKFECHKGSNGGEGLRGFRYSNGMTYLTHVEVEPKVEEVIL
jgi:hypothetical protein